MKTESTDTMDATTAPSAHVGFPPLTLHVTAPPTEGSRGAWWEAEACDEAFEQLVLAHRRRVFGLLLGCVGLAEEAEDLTQEVFLRAWRARARFRPSADPWPWLAAIAMNAARDWGRRRRPAQTPDDPDEMTQIAESRPSPRHHAEARQDLDRVRTALAHLPDRQREVLVLHAFGGLEIADIAKALDSNANAVRVSLHHARRRLREMLHDDQRGHQGHG